MAVPSWALLAGDTGGWWLASIPGCLGSGLSLFNWWISFAPEFWCCCFCGSSCLFCLSLNSDFYVSKICIYELGIFHANRATSCLGGGGGGRWGRGLVGRRLVSSPPPHPRDFIAGRNGAALLFWFFGGFRYGVPLFIVMLVIY